MSIEALPIGIFPIPRRRPAAATWLGMGQDGVNDLEWAIRSILRLIFFHRFRLYVLVSVLVPRSMIGPTKSVLRPKQ
jgi:hypothetical protein